MARTRRRLGAAATAATALAAAGVLAVALAASGAHTRTGPLVVAAGSARPPVPFVRGDGLYDDEGRRVPLAASVSGALMGPLSPVAVPSPDGTAVAYSSWPRLR
ncbi:MAG TPA: hypothetical protein VE261_05450, partial [Gaiellaceae bacterium]|nr:hypothetical protein [Gaiellaceae bacterium]